jgi:hypothetical protein
MRKKLLLLFILCLNLFALDISHSKIQNANTVLLNINEENISEVRLTFNKQNMDFYANPFDVNSFYILLPISYYEKPALNRVIISYIKNNKKVFIGIDL